MKEWFLNNSYFFHCKDVFRAGIIPFFNETLLMKTDIIIWQECYYLVGWGRRITYFSLELDWSTQWDPFWKRKREVIQKKRYIHVYMHTCVWTYSWWTRVSTYKWWIRVWTYKWWTVNYMVLEDLEVMEICAQCNEVVSKVLVPWNFRARMNFQSCLELSLGLKVRIWLFLCLNQWGFGCRQS